MRMTQMANHFRFHRPHLNMHSPIGDVWFGRRAESFARFFGTPRYLLMQTVLVLCWIALNAMGTLRSDPYPFILLNLAFSLQAAYAAPLILLAQTRQADREKAHTEADALHREALAQASLERQELSAKQSVQIFELLEQNTNLTKMTQELAQQIKQLSEEIHQRMTR